MKTGIALFSFMMVGASAECSSYDSSSSYDPSSSYDSSSSYDPILSYDLSLFYDFDFDGWFPHPFSFSFSFNDDDDTDTDDDITWDTEVPVDSGDFGDRGGIESWSTPGPTSSPMTWHTFSPSSSPTSSPSPSPSSAPTVPVDTSIPRGDSETSVSSSSNRTMVGGFIFPTLFLFTLVANTIIRVVA